MKLRFVSKRQEQDNIWSFFFECPEASWIAGQSIRLELPKPTWGVDERRFTIASSPSENIIQITTKLSDSTFKQSLSKLKGGQEINGYNIEGKFVWDTNNRHRLMLAGGMGITPYRALIKDKILKKHPCNTTLIYTSRDKHVFDKEFQAWTKQDDSLRIILLNKRLTLGNNATLLNNWLKCTIYISGSEDMVSELYQQFIDKKVPKSHIKTDIFTGIV